MDNEIAIKVEGVSKSFRLPHEKSGSVKSALLGWKKRKRGYENQRVLQNISFEVKKGEFFGIVGRNGSGKSTLLKLISEIYTPDKGSITINGKLTPFIELGVGFSPELSGRDNVYLNGAMLGFSEAEMDAMYDEIVEFAELERFMDQKLKNYSSGMQVRLAFSIAIRANTDILVLDEVLAVGDEAFQRKCEEYFAAVKKKKKTIVLVTHSMESVRKFCSKAMMIRKGKIVAIGSPDDVANEYSLDNLESSVRAMSSGRDAHNQALVVKDFKVELLSPRQISQEQKVEVKVSYTALDTIDAYTVVGLQSIDRNVRLFTKTDTTNRVKRGQMVSHIFSFNTSNLNDLSIKVMAAVYDKNDQALAYSKDHDSPNFQIRRTDYTDKKRTTALLINN